MRVINCIPGLITEYEELLGRDVQQKEISRATDIPEGTLSRYIRGRVDGAKFEIEYRLCQFFTRELGRKITRNDLFVFEDDSALESA